MSKTDSVGARLAELSALGDNLQSPDAVRLLRRSLAERSNHVVARAAELVAETRDESYTNDLVLAYRRFMSDPLRSDPGCVGKQAIIEALVRLQHEDIELYREGVGFQQLEPVWGGSKDTAAELRGMCAAGLVLCASSLEVLNRCAVLLADPCDEARMGAARAIAALRQPEGAPLLRLKLRTGDASPEVIGECCLALLRLDGEAVVPFVVEFLAADNADVRVQAALALGEWRLPGTFEPLRQAHECEREPAVRESLLICIGLLRSSESADFLISLIDSDDVTSATDAIQALQPYGKSGDLRGRVEAAVQSTGNPRLRAVFEKEWNR